jgi:DNA (cytosine-5)-methyltransferase 1
VFVVGCLGGWESAAKVLFESESLSGDIKQGRKTKQEIARNFVPSVANCLQTTSNDYSRADGFNMIAYSFDDHREGLRIYEESTSTLCAAAGTGGGNVPLTMAIQGNLIGRDAGGPQGIGISNSNTMYTLTKTDVHAVAFTTEQTPKFNNEQALTLTQSEHKHNQCVMTSQFVDTYNGTIQGNVAATMTADMAGPTHSGPKVMQNMAVRRLTEVECERLQGFPDNYTNIKENCPSGARYKALGNSMAVPVMRWIGERINQYERI